MPTWDPYEARTPRPARVSEWSCCDAYEWCSEAGQYFTRRRTETGYEETGRGIYAKARLIWDELVDEHKQSHCGR